MTDGRGIKNIVAKKDLKIEDIGEFGFIRSIMNDCHFSPEKLIKGIGDDCAVIGPYKDKVFLITTDLLVEGVHFILERIPPEHLGEKAVAVNLSDIAAMGGNALHLFLSVAIPRSMSLETIHLIYRGIKTVCRRYNVNILGGDTSSSPEKLMINVTVIGDATEKEVLYRSGARAGDAIYITDTLGNSAAGLKLIKEELFAPDNLASSLIDAHNRPVPFLEAGRMIARSRLASAMIDLSDGLLSDLQRICEASCVGARIFHNSLPLSEELKVLAEINNLDPYEFVLSGGEDYRLLITIPGKNLESFQKLFEKQKPCPVYHVGEITKELGSKMIRPDGKEELLEVTGFDHFART